MAPQDRHTTLFDHIDSLNSITALLEIYDSGKTHQDKLCKFDNLDEALLVLNAADWELEELVDLKNYLTSRRDERLERTQTTEADPHWAEAIMLAADVMRNCPFLESVHRDARGRVPGLYGSRVGNERPSTPLGQVIDTAKVLSETNTRDWTNDQLEYTPAPRLFDENIGLEREIQHLRETLSTELKGLRAGEGPSLDRLIDMDTCAVRDINRTRTRLKKLGVDTPPIPQLFEMLPPDRLKRRHYSPNPGELVPLVPEIPLPFAYGRDEAGTSAAGNQSKSADTPTDSKRRRLFPPLSPQRRNTPPPSIPSPRTPVTPPTNPPVNHPLPNPPGRGVIPSLRLPVIPPINHSTYSRGLTAITPPPQLPRSRHSPLASSGDHLFGGRSNLFGAPNPNLALNSRAVPYIAPEAPPPPPPYSASADPRGPNGPPPPYRADPSNSEDMYD
ncbi:hypothetical protein F4776DRAFT_307995 [Hypoxylon sp. NC0597]|nr:hypothetical protein F4776DRAFT_307995 [Hypoxylon sp. NC0597]